MELLAKTSQVLYDYDIINKQNEIKTLKMPRVLYSDMNEWESLKCEAIEHLRKNVSEFVSEKEYHQMRDFGITPNQSMNGFSQMMFNSFNHLLKKQANDWVFTYAETVSHTVIATVETLVEIDVWNNIFDKGQTGVCNFFLEILLKIFDEGSDAENIDTITCTRFFLCETCGEENYWVEEGKCYNCCYPER